MSTLTLWSRRDPFADLDSVVRRAFPTVYTKPLRSIGFTPAADVDKDRDDAVIRLELPGVDVARDVTVEVDRSHLVVRGERRDERTENVEGRSVREVRYGSFRRSFALPEHVAGDAVSASYHAGVLTVRVAGVYAGSQPQQVAISTTVPVQADGETEQAEQAEQSSE